METLSPSDWPNTFPEIKEIDNLLRCPICFELMSTSLVIPKCSHNYCSLCIRQYIRYQNKCPVCNEAVCEIDLKNNRLIDQMISAFTSVRQRLLDALKDSVTKSTALNTSNSHTPVGKAHPSKPLQFTETPRSGTSSQKHKNRTSGSHLRGQESIRGLCVPGRSLVEIEATKFDDDESDIKRPKTRTTRKKNAALESDSEESDCSDVIFCEDIPEGGQKRKLEPRLASRARKYCGSPNSAEDVSDSDEDFMPFTPGTKRSPAGFMDKRTKKSTNATQKGPQKRPSPDVKYTNKEEITNISPNSVPQLCSPLLAEKDEGTKSIKTNTANETFTEACTSVMHRANTTNILSAQEVDINTQSTPMKTSVSAPSLSPSCASSVDNGSGATDTSSSTDSGRVPCPVCGVNIPERHINLHLDMCLKNQAKYQEQRRVGGSGSKPRRKPMPKLVYNLMSDKELKKRLANDGLSNQGDKKTLIARHQEFTLLYNSECDSENPKSVAQIVREMEKKSQMKCKLAAADTWKGKLTIEKGADSFQVEKAQKSYVKEHKSQFGLLIQQATKHAKEKMAKKRAIKEEKDKSVDVEANTGSTGLLVLDEPQSTFSPTEGNVLPHEPQSMLHPPVCDVALLDAQMMSSGGFDAAEAAPAFKGPELPTLNVSEYELDTDSEPDVASETSFGSQELIQSGDMLQLNSEDTLCSDSFPGYLQSSLSPRQPIAKESVLRPAMDDAASDITMSYGGSETEGEEDSTQVVVTANSNVELSKTLVTANTNVELSKTEPQLYTEPEQTHSQRSAPTPSPTILADSPAESTSRSLTMDKPDLLCFSQSQNVAHVLEEQTAHLSQHSERYVPEFDLLSTFTEDLETSPPAGPVANHPTLVENSPGVEKDVVNYTQVKTVTASDEAASGPIPLSQQTAVLKSNSDINSSPIPDSPEFVKVPQRTGRKRGRPAAAESSSQSTSSSTAKRRKTPVIPPDTSVNGRRLTRAQLRSQNSTQ